PSGRDPWPRAREDHYNDPRGDVPSPRDRSVRAAPPTRRCCMRRLPLVLMLLILPLAARAGSPLDKLDPRCRAALAALRAGSGAGRTPGSRMAVSASGDLDVFIRGPVTREQLEAAGARVRTALPGIFTAFVPSGAIESVAAL